MCLHVSRLVLVFTSAAVIVHSHLPEGNNAQKAELGSFWSFVTQSIKHVHSEKNTLGSLGQNVDFNCKRRFLRSEDLWAHVTAIGASAGGQQLRCGGLFSALPPKLPPTIQSINYKPFTPLETATGTQFQMSFSPTSAWSNLLLWFEGKWLFENVKINLQPIGAVYLQMHYSSPQPSVWEMHICVSWILQIRQEKRKEKKSTWEHVSTSLPHSAWTFSGKCWWAGDWKPLLERQLWDQCRLPRVGEPFWALKRLTGDTDSSH